MSTLTYLITTQAETLRSADADLKAAIERYNKVKGLGNQQGYSVTIDGVTIQIAQMDRHYVPRLIRGREMIHLGALKALDANVDNLRARVKAERLKLADLAERLATQARGNE